MSSILFKDNSEIRTITSKTILHAFCPTWIQNSCFFHLCNALLETVTDVLIRIVSLNWIPALFVNEHAISCNTNCMGHGESNTCAWLAGWQQWYPLPTKSIKIKCFTLRKNYTYWFFWTFDGSLAVIFIKETHTKLFWHDHVRFKIPITSQLT